MVDARMCVLEHTGNILSIDNELSARLKRFGGVSCLVAIGTLHCVNAGTPPSTAIPIEPAWQLETGG